MKNISFVMLSAVKHLLRGAHTVSAKMEILRFTRNDKRVKRLALLVTVLVFGFNTAKAQYPMEFNAPVFSHTPHASL